MDNVFSCNNQKWLEFLLWWTFNIVYQFDNEIHNNWKSVNNEKILNSVLFYFKYKLQMNERCQKQWTLDEKSDN